jgi:hypothetical protein
MAVPWKDREIWWRPWVLLPLILINAFVLQNFQHKFFLILVIIVIFAGISWLTVLAYAFIIVPGYFHEAYGWITLHSFLLLLTTIIILQITHKIRSMGKPDTPPGTPNG